MAPLCHEDLILALSDDTVDGNLARGAKRAVHLKELDMIDPVEVAVDVDEAPEVSEDVLVEEVSIDGMCGVY
jgi:mycofactocin precursor